mmetsp:Transcript_1357/g.2824  ORF Transcript_1357/g.2824 Transcript_1357/m.2824 type:complete len:213 (-) Transcript_1357:62-700(-)
MSQSQRIECKPVRAPALANVSELVLAIELGADPTRGRADAEHERRLLGAQLGERPALAPLVVIHAARRAHAARLGAVLHHGERVELALVGIRPYVALRLILVDAHRAVANAAGEWTRPVHERRVGEALAAAGPAWTVRVEILARLLAHLARHRALARHKLRVLVAGIVLRPCLALELAVLARRRADPAADGARLKHIRGVALALPVLRPRRA